MTRCNIDLQKVSKEKHFRPHKREVDKWFSQLVACLDEWSDVPERYSKRDLYSLTLRIVDEKESIKLNNSFRSVNHATNVLSFPFDSPVQETDDYLGDLVMCGAVIEREAKAGGLPVKDYWAKLFIHGCLHLFGYSHDNDEDYAQMEAVSEAVMVDILRVKGKES